jgi:hypothetical protein
MAVWKQGKNISDLRSDAALLEKVYGTILRSDVHYATMAEWWRVGRNRIQVKRIPSTANLSTINLLKIHQELDADLSGEKPDSDRLNYGTALLKVIHIWKSAELVAYVENGAKSKTSGDKNNNNTHKFINRR